MIDPSELELRISTEQGERLDDDEKKFVIQSLPYVKKNVKKFEKDTAKTRRMHFYYPGGDRIEKMMKTVEIGVIIVPSAIIMIIAEAALSYHVMSISIACMLMSLFVLYLVGYTTLLEKVIYGSISLLVKKRLTTYRDTIMNMDQKMKLQGFSERSVRKMMNMIGIDEGWHVSTNSYYVGHLNPASDEKYIELGMTIILEGKNYKKY